MFFDGIGAYAMWGAILTPVLLLIVIVLLLVLLLKREK